MVSLPQTVRLSVQPRRQVGHSVFEIKFYWSSVCYVLFRMPSTDLDDFIPPAPPMQAPGPPWRGDYPQDGGGLFQLFN